MNRHTEIALHGRGTSAPARRPERANPVLRLTIPVTAEPEAGRAERNRPVVRARFTVARQFNEASVPFAAGLLFEHNAPTAGDTASPGRGARAVKRTFDIVCAGALLLTLSPLFALLALLIKATSGGPVLYQHARVGRNGERFRCFKYRTMVTNADAVLQELLTKDPQARREWEENVKLRGDPRIIPVGRFLRRTSLDELPQLWNVLCGEMSLVGPRPIVVKEMERYGRDIRCYLASVPGITGLWQISGRNELSYKDRVRLDSWYARNWCLSLDFLILFKTIKAMISGRGAY